MKLPKIKRFPFTEILGWSVSRFDTFSNCQRQYFYNYYPRYDREVPTEKIQKLKALTSYALEVGNIVHDSIRDLLLRLQKSSKPISRPNFMKYVRNMTEKYCSSKTFCEVYYKQKDRITVDEVFVQVEKILDNFLKSDRLKWIFETALQEKDNWVIEPEGFGETRINDYKAYCKVDFLIPVNEKIYILDWKTGKQDLTKHTRQLVGYSLWASYHFGVDTSSIVPTVVYLNPGYFEEAVNITDDMLSNFQKQVEEETKVMYDYLKNIEHNVPKEKDCFAKTDKEFFCKYCNFRELCRNGEV